MNVYGKFSVDVLNALEDSLRQSGRTTRLLKEISGLPEGELARAVVLAHSKAMADVLKRRWQDAYGYLPFTPHFVGHRPQGRHLAHTELPIDLQGHLPGPPIFFADHAWHLANTQQAIRNLDS